MSDFRFAEPALVHALWGVLAFVAALLWLERRGGSALGRLVGTPLQSRLVERPAPWRRSLRIALLGLAAASAVLALMRPQWGMREIASGRAGAELMVALDVSRSMLAEDVAPNRLERAKAEIVDLLSYLDGDQVGLIAFAGRAAVLCPLTPDFGFLRTVLEHAGPGSVGRGGTRLAEPIRRAVEGFGVSEGAARALLLITDGEDHDSFALDAAKAAAERGVKIIAIGFGDEAGSEILVTNPRTGARERVVDADGRPVRTRLDGALLRELALATDGAYVPAGTGVLDLESIYEQHIARLVRGELDGRRTVRDEGYPWFVLLSLLLLVSSVAVASGRVRGVARVSAASLLLAGALGAVAPAFDVAAQQAPDGAALLPALADAPAADAEDGASTVADAGTPREVYNRGVGALAEGDLDAAESAFERARREARGDDRLRHHAAFNLGWADVRRAGRLRAEAPGDALAQLYRAADWFREAVRLDPEDEDARVNLEVTLKRALVLADEIARASDGGIEGALDALVVAQRGEVQRAAGLVEQAAREGAASPTEEDGPALRGAYRAAATAQRGVLADADQLAARVTEELDALEARPEEDRTPEDAMRVAQLGGVRAYLHRARERMGQARRQLRERRAERGYRRVSAALQELKRAEDQLRDPVAVLDHLLRDGTEIARGTQLVSLADRMVPGSPAPPVPAWLSVDGLADEQRTHAERTRELDARLLAGLTQADSALGQGEAGLDPEQAAMLAAVREAEPFVAAAAERLAVAADALAAGTALDAREPQRQALAALADARERFLDLRGLIEATHAAQRQIGSVLTAATGEEAAADPAATAVARAEIAPELIAAQEKNLARAERLDAQLQEALSSLNQQVLAAESGAAPADPNAPPVDPERLAAEQERLDIAGQLLTLALGGMDGVASVLAPVEGVHPADDDSWIAAREGSGISEQHLDGLRRLFFSIVEHVRELLRRQVDLGDETQDALALSQGPDVEPAELAARLLPAERRLASDTLAIADALEQQSREAAAAAPSDPTTADPAATENAERLRKAAEHVLLAQGEMENAAGALDPNVPAPGADPIDLEGARTSEQAAVEELAAALALLEPPQPQQDPGDQQQQQQQQEQEQQRGEQSQEREAGEQAETPPERSVDPAQLLQEVRDREAQRRRERARNAAGYEPVEKDW